MLPCSGQCGLNLPFTSHIAVILPSRFDCVSRKDCVVLQISVQPESAFAEIAFDNIELVDTALGVITMFRRKEKVPLPPISQNCQLHALSMAEQKGTTSAV